MTTAIILVGRPGALPVAWEDVVNELPAGITPYIPVKPSLGDIERLADKQELRKVVLVAYGGGAAAAAGFAAAQPHRVTHLVLIEPLLGADQHSEKVFRTVFRFVPNFVVRRTGTSKQEVLDGIATFREQLAHVKATVTVLGDGPAARSAAEHLGVNAQPGGADYRTAPKEFVRAIVRVLSENGDV